MNNLIKGVVTVLIAVTLTSCTWDNRDTGTAAGAVVGGVAGNLVTGGSAVGTGIGVLGGALVGNQVAR